MNGEHLNKIIHGDSLQILSGFDDNSIDLVLTDPPYFLDKMDNGWDEKKVASTKYHHVVKSLPAGMKFDREQGKNFYEWYYKISKQILRVLKPGGFFFSFSSPRLYHRMVSAIDDAGLLIRDCFIWLYTQNQPKAMSLNHFIEKLNEVVDKCFLISKPDKKEKGDFNLHRTVKPLSLCEYIVNLTTYSNEAVVLDPFAGSGTALVAAKKTGRKFIGIDINKEYIEIAIRRIKSFEVDSSRYNAVSEEKQLRI